MGIVIHKKLLSLVLREKTYPIRERTNLVTIKNMARLDDIVHDWGNEDFDILMDHIIETKRNGCPVIWLQGARWKITLLCWREVWKSSED